MVVRRPSEEDADDDEASNLEDVYVEPFQTPVALTPANWKSKKGKDRVSAEDTELADTVVNLESSNSDIGVVEREESVTKVQAACTSFVIDGMILFKNSQYQPPERWPCTKTDLTSK